MPDGPVIAKDLMVIATLNALKQNQYGKSENQEAINRIIDSMGIRPMAV